MKRRILALYQPVYQKYYWGLVVLYMISLLCRDPVYTACLKPLPIVFLILRTLIAPVSRVVRGLLIFALSMATIGDILLAQDSLPMVVFGSMAFACMHIAYILLLAPHYRSSRPDMYLFLLMLAVSIVTYAILLPRLLETSYMLSVYPFFLLTMVFFALQAKKTDQNLSQTRLSPIVINPEDTSLRWGGVLFWISDNLLGVSLFIWHSVYLSVLVMLTYYMSQWCLFSGILIVKPARSLERDNALCSFTGRDAF